MSTAIAALRDKPDGAMEGQGPDPASAQDRMAATPARPRQPTLQVIITARTFAPLTFGLSQTAVQQTS